jgi:outer membrane lipoprotein SlyB
MQIARTHPIVIAAAAAVLLFSLLGAAALSGVLPFAASKPGDAAAVAQRNATAQPRLAQVARCASCGVVEAIRTVEVQGEASGLGAAAGGVTGAVVGNQIGRGDTRTVMTVAGAAGGAYAGHQIEKQLKKSTAWRITVRLDDGSVRTLSQPAAPPFAIGDRVRIVNGSGLERA